ncbi:hypothetical protein AB0E11_00320 [Streptomyces fradiae]|uniref:hypothetical protein n=1 Tax=Streptomyces fradiae TaxID=1906 RepID=UPI003400CC00
MPIGAGGDGEGNGDVPPPVRGGGAVPPVGRGAGGPEPGCPVYPEDDAGRHARDGLQSGEETAHLLRSPANARALLESIAELDAGRGLVEEPADTGDGG